MTAIVRLRLTGILMAATCALAASPASTDHKPAELVGSWRGTSTCTDLVAAPGCRDEVVVYDFTAGDKPGTVRWKADKMVDGQRQPMGEMDLQYDEAGRCWAAELSTPRVRIAWCLVVDGTHLTGTGRLLPDNQTVRKVDARKQ